MPKMSRICLMKAEKKTLNTNRNHFASAVSLTLMEFFCKCKYLYEFETMCENTFCISIWGPDGVSKRGENLVKLSI